MKKLVYSALALSVTSAGALASDTDWSTLDQEIEALTASTSLENSGPAIGGRIRTSYFSSSDLGDVGDFQVNDARVHATGSNGDYGYKVQVDFADEPELLDAYVDFAIGGQVNARMGNFKAGMSRSALIGSGNLFFTGRNVVGNDWAQRTEGLMLSGEFDQLGWWLGFMDGNDAEGDEYLMTAKVDFDVMGEGMGANEGAYGGSESPSMTIGIGMWDDGGNDADGTIIEAHAGTNVWSFGVDMLDAGDAAQTSQGGIGWVDAAPMSIMGTYMLQPDAWELGVRLDDFDDNFDTSAMSIGVNHYISGHDLKWTIEMTTLESDALADDISAITVQLNLAF
jgi:hypothetical protein